MPWYHCEPEKNPGSEFPPFFPCGVMDRYGNVPIYKYVKDFDTDTGRVSYLVEDHVTGRPVIDHENGRAVVVTVYLPPPLAAVEVIPCR